MGFCHGIFVQLVSLSFHTLTVTDAVARTTGCIRLMPYCLSHCKQLCSVFQHTSSLISIPFTSFKQQDSCFLGYFLCLSISIKPRAIIQPVMQGNSVRFTECFIKIKCWCGIRIWIAGLFNCPCASALKCVRE